MAFIDELTLHIKAGRGGDGVVRWRHEKGKEFGGPSGGNGGRGGDVYIRAVRDIALLSKYAHKKSFEAGDGEDGRKNSEHGEGGDDLIIDLPIGSVVSNRETGERFSLEREGQQILILKGGRGGRGNESFKSSTNRRPKEWTAGQAGQEADFDIELELFADAGFVGLPNAGKSTLLNALTGAQAKTADYPFTTLEPNLGVLYGFVLADIPGLIEGAAEGKGLGVKFLRHIKRTKLLIHTISLENDDVVHTYKTVRDELVRSGKGLDAKPEIIVLTKKDVVSSEAVAAAKAALAPLGREVFAVSAYDDRSLKSFSDALVKIMRKYERDDSREEG